MSYGYGRYEDGDAIMSEHDCPGPHCNTCLEKAKEQLASHFDPNPLAQFTLEQLKAEVKARMMERAEIETAEVEIRRLQREKSNLDNEIAKVTKTVNRLKKKQGLL